jgi:DNA-binding LacI/PurR family transcriptional regulator
MQATLEDVASLAGVSIKTVSRVVNGQGEVSDATHKRVQAAIDKLGYRLNILACSLVNGQTKTLAAVVGGPISMGHRERSSTSKRKLTS